MTRLRLGTRGSALALAQARIVARRLESAGHACDIVTVRTEGDRNQSDDSLLAGSGVFVTALQEALVAGEVDLAVHSAKDLPTDERDDTLLAFPARGEARDALVGATLEGLPRGARVATESPRRRAFLLHARPDLDVVPMRGNVDTRLSRLDGGACDALVLAACGLERLGLAERIGEVLPLEVMVPAVGQGALAVETRAGDEGAEWIAGLNDAAVGRAVRAERRFLAAMGGGCRAPFAAHARGENGRLVVDGAAVGPDGREAMRERIEGSGEEADALGAELAARLLARGAARLAQADA